MQYEFLIGVIVGVLGTFGLMWKPNPIKDLGEEDQAEQAALQAIASQAIETPQPAKRKPGRPRKVA